MFVIAAYKDMDVKLQLKFTKSIFSVFPLSKMPPTLNPRVLNNACGMTVETRRSTYGGHGASVLVSVIGTMVVGRTHYKAQIDLPALLMSSTSLFSGIKNCFIQLPVLTCFHHYW